MMTNSQVGTGAMGLSCSTDRMYMIGKLLGGALGYMVAGLPGGLVGSLLGHALDAGRQESERTREARPVGGNDGNRQRPSAKTTAEPEQTVFFTTTFVLMGYVASASGNLSAVRQKELGALISTMGLVGEQRRQAALLLACGRKPGFDPVPLIRESSQQGRPSWGSAVMDILVQVALTEQPMTPASRSRLNRLAKLLGLSTGVVTELIDKRGGSSKKSGVAAPAPDQGSLTAAYACLELPVGASADEIKRAYRRLVSRHHPDRVAGSGASAPQIQEATSRLQEVRNAYDRLRRAPGKTL